MLPKAPARIASAQIASEAGAPGAVWSKAVSSDGVKPVEASTGTWSPPGEPLAPGRKGASVGVSATEWLRGPQSCVIGRRADAGRGPGASELPGENIGETVRTTARRLSGGAACPGRAE